MITLLSLFLRRTAGPGESSTQTARPGLYPTDDQWSGHGCHKAIGVTKWQTDFPDPQRIPAPLVTGVPGRRNRAPNRDRQRGLGN